MPHPMRILCLCLSLLLAFACTPALAHAGDDSLPPASKPGAVLLLVATTPDGTVTTFGQSGGDGGATGAALARAVEALGFRLKSAAGQPVAVTTEGGGSGSLVPLGDAAALDVARKLGAGVAFVVGVHVKPDGGIRGTNLLGAAGRGQLRLLDAQSGAAVASADLEGAGFDAAADRAAAAAGRDIAERLMRAIEGPANNRWPTSAASAGGATVVVEVRGARAWSSVSAIIQKLGATEGVAAVHARDVRRGHIALAVETRLAARNLAASVERARLPSGTLRATARGDSQVQVEIRGDAAGSAAPGAQP
ncbi:MAG TPA: hypothetical protein VFU21_03380 [Kofleriaceae bacterium]|nr:hypothetical protein [Kofleriaceae bacterium]